VAFSLGHLCGYEWNDHIPATIFPGDENEKVPSAFARIQLRTARIH
jgi:hypothetical protein